MVELTHDWFGPPNDENTKQCNLWRQLVISKLPVFLASMALLILHAHKSVLTYLVLKQEWEKCCIFKIVFVLGLGFISLICQEWQPFAFL